MARGRFEKLDAGGESVRSYASGAGDASAGVVVFHPWWGLNDDVIAYADRLAGAGFEVVAPDLVRGRIAATVEEAERSYASSMTMLFEGALLALVVVFVFLRDWRATWVSAVALPLSIIPTFAVMHWFGFSLNLITLLALSVVVGILAIFLGGGA